jgi:hypothetical protein
MRVVGLIFWLCHRQNITLAPRYIPSADNVVYALSRRTMAEAEWQISDWLFDWIQNQWGPHDVDRFASHACHVSPRYNSAFWDPLTEAVDGLAQDWRGVNNFVHPPPSLLLQVVQKLRRARGVACTAVVAPDWPGQPWYLPLMVMASRVRVLPVGVFAFVRDSATGGRLVLPAKWPVLVVRVRR